MRYIERIAKENQEERKNAIISILEELNIEYALQKTKCDSHSPENIVVSYNPSNTRLVIGAHWDSIEGSTGANDNASGCSVLLHLADKLRKTKHSIDFVFFDREEYEDHGSQTYIELTGRKNISAMINLDICGAGDKIAVSEKGNKGNLLFYNVMRESVLEKHNVTLLSFLPNGDDDRFTEANIPNISICAINENDISFFKYLSDKIINGKELTIDDQERFMRLEVVSTMHLGENDNIGAVSQNAIDILVNYLLDGLL